MIKKKKKYNYARQFATFHLMTIDTPGLNRPKKFQKTHKPRSYNMSISPAEEKKKKKVKRNSNIPSTLHHTGVEMFADILDGLVSMQGVSEIPERIGKTVT